MLALALALSTTWSGIPTDDVWVYPHSSDPGAETILRVWGDGERAQDDMFPSDSFSYGFLRWKPEFQSKPLKSAKLVLFAEYRAEITEAILKKYPLEVYVLDGAFNEKAFVYTQTQAVPQKEALVKTPTVTKEGNFFRMEFDLKNEKFQAIAEKKPETLGFALASKINPAESRSLIYRVISKEGDEDKRPRLTLEFAD